MLVVTWLSSFASAAQTWRVLDLSGITKSVRQSGNFVKAGYVYVEGDRVPDFRHTVPLGVPLSFELRFPNGVIKPYTVKVIPREYAPTRRARMSSPTKLNRKG